MQGQLWIEVEHERLDRMAWVIAQHAHKIDAEVKYIPGLELEVECDADLPGVSRSMAKIIADPSLNSRLDSRMRGRRSSRGRADLWPFRCLIHIMTNPDPISEVEGSASHTEVLPLMLEKKPGQCPLEMRIQTITWDTRNPRSICDQLSQRGLVLKKQWYECFFHDGYRTIALERHIREKFLV